MAMADADIPYESLSTTDPEQIALGDVRSLIPDIEQLANPIDPTEDDTYIFSDATIARYLRLNGGNIKRAAASACDVLGTSEALILKVITTDDLVTNGAALMKEYGERAKRLRAEAAQDDNLENSSDGMIVTGPLHIAIL